MFLVDDGGVDVVHPRNLVLKLGQNQVSNRFDIVAVVVVVLPLRFGQHRVNNG